MIFFLGCLSIICCNWCITMRYTYFHLIFTPLLKNYIYPGSQVDMRAEYSNVIGDEIDPYFETMSSLWGKHTFKAKSFRTHFQGILIPRTQIGAPYFGGLTHKMEWVNPKKEINLYFEVVNRGSMGLDFRTCMGFLPLNLFEWSNPDIPDRITKNKLI